MVYKVGDSAIKISFIQALPGKEFEAVEGLKAACKEFGVDKKCILKGLGAFDIVLIYKNDDYNSVLTKAGPIDGIVKTSRSFAFCYVRDDKEIDLIFDKIGDSLFASVSLIKINQNKGANFLEIETKIREHFLEGDGGVGNFILGTLGWNEIILISAGNDINQIIKSSFWSTNAIFDGVVSKTYSCITLNFEKFPTEVFDSGNGQKINEVVKGTEELDTRIDENINVNVSITTLPAHTPDICRYWEALGYKTHGLVGKEDVLVVPPERITWADLLACLLQFRAESKDKILSTSTNISLAYESTEGRTAAAAVNPLNSVPYTFSFLEKHFSSQATQLASTLNTFNGLLQNNIIGNAFADMARYPDYIFAAGPEFKEEHERLDFALGTADLLKKGAEVRLYGTHGTIEETVGQFTKLRGGVQRALIASSFIPNVVLNRVWQNKKEWKGFIKVSPDQFSNSSEVINIPAEALWDPGLWWALYHESSHILIDYMKRQISADVPQLQLFLADKNYPEAWMGFVVELSAEYFGFEFGFYGDYDLLFDKFWRYIKHLSTQKSHLSPLSVYAVRTFFVQAFKDVYVDGIKEETYFSNYDQVYDDIVQHIEKIEKVPGGNNSEALKKLYFEKHFIGAYYGPRIKELVPWMREVFAPFVKDFKLRRNRAEIDDQNTNDVLCSLEEGIMWDGELKYPEAVLYRLFKSGDVSFKTSIATVLTFWNLEKRRLDSKTCPEEEV